MDLEKPFPDAIDDIQTWANVVHDARLMIVGLLLIQIALLLARRLVARARSDAFGAREFVLATIAGLMLGASSQLLGVFLDVLMDESAERIPGLLALGALGALAMALARSRSPRAMRSLQIVNALWWPACAAGLMLMRGSVWDDLLYQTPLVVIAGGALMAALFVGRRWFDRGRRGAAPDRYDSRLARRLAMVGGCSALLWCGYVLSVSWLDEARPWRHYQLPIASMHVWNESPVSIEVSSRPAGEEEWARFDEYMWTGRDGAVLSRYDPGCRDWTHRAAEGGQCGPLDLRLALTGELAREPVILSHVFVGDHEHLRLRVDFDGNVWMSRGPEGWLGSIAFGPEEMVSPAP